MGRFRGKRTLKSTVDMTGPCRAIIANCRLGIRIQVISRYQLTKVIRAPRDSKTLSPFHNRSNLQNNRRLNRE